CWVGRIDMDKKTLDLGKLLGTFAQSQSERLAAQGFSLIIESGMPSISANESRTLQVFENILSNALKYANPPEGGCLHIRAVNEPHWLHIYCQDNGPGISPEYHEKIFGLFYRLDPHIEGTGVGLAVARKIMKFHCGDIRVEPQAKGAEKGANFRITFPKDEGGEVDESA
ncbi:MAG: sensor histidine kinase, partial [Candidatus Electrothrix sp. AR3]|nr:sensor histidine kinase [Candidatus Electrothrix sp. AR3]